MQEVKRRFELPSWGLSYRKALEYVVDSDASSNIRIILANHSGRVNVLMLSPRNWGRVTMAQAKESADYFITNYRYHPEPDRPLAKRMVYAWATRPSSPSSAPRDSDRLT